MNGVAMPVVSVRYENVEGWPGAREVRSTSK